MTHAALVPRQFSFRGCHGHLARAPWDTRDTPLVPKSSSGWLTAHRARVLLLGFLFGVLFEANLSLADETLDPIPATVAIPQELLDGPLADVEEIIFAVRVSGRDH